MFIFIAEFDFYISRARKSIILAFLFCFFKHFAQRKPFKPTTTKKVFDGSGTLQIQANDFFLFLIEILRKQSMAIKLSS